MAWQFISLLPILLSFSLVIQTTSTSTSKKYLTLGVNCNSTKGNYTENSPFHTNLLNAFSNLTALSSSHTFSNFTAGSDADAINKVNALYDCRLDFTLQTCHDCVETATKKMLNSCSAVEAIIIYEECILRYANREIVSTLDTTMYPYLACDNGIADGGELERTIESIFTRLINNVTKNSSSRYFGVEERSYFEYQKMYCLVQCTPDLSRDQCRSCLMDGFMNFTIPCAGNLSRLSSTFIGPNCQLIYNFVPFSNLFTGIRPMASSPPMLSPEGSQEKMGDGGQRVVSSMGFVFLFFFFVILF